MNMTARILTSAILVTGLVSLGSVPAGAASTDGTLRILGPGSVYTGPHHVVSLAARPGTSAKFSMQVVNTGSTPAQYRVAAPQQFDVTPQVAYGSLNITSFATGPDGWYTPVIAGGKALTLTVKLAASQPEPSVGAIQFELDATDGSQLAIETAYVVPFAGTGTQQSDLNVRSGSQPFVDANTDVREAIETAPSVKPGQTASFLVRLRNDGSTPSQLGLELGVLISDCADISATFALKATVLQSGHTVDVTDQLKNGGYLSPVVPAKGYKDVTVTVHYVALTDGCTSVLAHVLTWSSDGGFNNGQSGVLVINTAA
jgi:hypothetical protein